MRVEDAETVLSIEHTFSFLSEYTLHYIIKDHSQISTEMLSFQRFSLVSSIFIYLIFMHKCTKVDLSPNQSNPILIASIKFCYSQL